jgi:hypothetical protein
VGRREVWSWWGIVDIFGGVGVVVGVFGFWFWGWVWVVVVLMRLVVWLVVGCWRSCELKLWFTTYAAGFCAALSCRKLQ